MRADEQTDRQQRLIFLVRVVLTLAVAYLTVFGETPAGMPAILFGLAYVASNALFLALPERVLRHPYVDPGIVLVDTVIAAVALLRGGHGGSQAVVLFFGILLLASIAGRPRLGLAACMTVVAAYAAHMLQTRPAGEVLQPATLLQLPFFLITGAFYAVFLERIQTARARSQEDAERERARRQFLAHITRDIEQPLATARTLAGLLLDNLDTSLGHQRTLASQVVDNLHTVSHLVALTSQSRTPAPRVEGAAQ